MEKFFENQKAMFDQWQEYMKKMAGEYNPEKMQEIFKANFDADATTREFWNKVQESSKTCQAVLELWKSFSEKNVSLDSQSAMEILDRWTKQGFSTVRAALEPNTPEYMRDFVSKAMDRMESTSEKAMDYAKVWASTEENVSRAFVDSFGKGPEGYIAFLKEWQDSYDATLGKLMKAPTFGRNMDFLTAQKNSFDQFIRYGVASSRFYGSLANIMHEATRKVLDDVAAMQKEGTEPKTFQEFYKYWNRVVSQYFDRFLSTDEISRMAGEMVNEMSKFKIEYDKLCEYCLSGLPIPTKSDMDDLYRTVHDLKLEVRRMKRELKALKAAQNSVTA